VFDLPKPLLKQLLTFKNTAPERLSNSELEIANRVCHCTKCDNFWVRRKAKLPDRCPDCHARDWDRPLIAAMLAAEGASHPPAPKSSPNPQHDGGEL
jgi:hypothetical protein